MLLLRFLLGITISISLMLATNYSIEFLKSIKKG
jgi:hypothetical protein